MLMKGTPKKRRHVIISGTGRAGTSFLVQLLTALKQDTGFGPNPQLLPNCDGGLETNLSLANAPYFVKDPWLCESLRARLQADRTLRINHALVPIRDLYSAAESRRDVTRRATPSERVHFGKVIPGGEWPSLRDEPQESILAKKLYHLLDTCAEYEIPVTFLRFPRFAVDARYLYRNIFRLLKDVRRAQFFETFAQISKPEKIHQWPRQRPNPPQQTPMTATS